MKSRRTFAIAGLVGVVGIAALALWYQRRQTPAGVPVPAIPEALATELPSSCRQVILVLSPDLGSVPATLWLLERLTADAGWEPACAAIPVSLGRSGLAWGIGEHRQPPPSGFPVKREGDGCSPAGIFRIPYAFGYAESTGAGSISIPYLPLTAASSGIDDLESLHYNQVVDSASVQPDWKSAETMVRPDGLYRWGAFVAHNPARERGAGSCIFLHLWRGPGQPTAGCTAMAEDDLKRVLQWLDPAKEPRLVQTTLTHF